MAHTSAEARGISAKFHVKPFFTSAQKPTVNIKSSYNPIILYSMNKSTTFLYLAIFRNFSIYLTGDALMQITKLANERNRQFEYQINVF